MRMLTKFQQRKRLPNRMAALEKVKRVVDSCETVRHTFSAQRMISFYSKQYQISLKEDTTIWSTLDLLRTRCQQKRSRLLQEQIEKGNE